MGYSHHDMILVYIIVDVDFVICLFRVVLTMSHL